MAESELREPFRIAASLRALSPGISIAVQGNASDAQLLAPLPEFCRPIRFPDRLQIWEERPGFGQALQQDQNFLAESHLTLLPRLLAPVSNRLAFQIEVFGFQGRHIRLAATQMPAHPVKRLSFGIALGGENPLVFLKRDRPGFSVLHLGPLTPQDDRPG